MEDAMFVYSLKASTLKFFAVVCVALTALVMMITFIPSYDSGEIKYITTGNETDINYSKIKTNEDRIAFLSQFGWRVNDDPVEEVDAAKQILRAINMEGQCGLDIVSCPTCSRTKIDLISLVKRFEAAVREAGLEDVPVKVALMGCIVNGPGEAREADVGIAGEVGRAVLIRHGEIVEKIPENVIIERLLQEIRILKERM